MRDNAVKDLSYYEQRLRARLSELTERISEVESELDQPANADFEERASEREGDEVLESLGAASVNEIRMIQAALKRIEEGTYGECVNCGEDIAQKRLEAVPHAARCVRCA
jgi:RNA polymerase-binding protein DksA